MRLTLSRLEYDTGGGTIVATLPDGSTEKTLGGTPGGSSGQFQYDNAGAFAGTANLVVGASGKAQLPAGGIEFKNGSSIGTLAWNPTSTRSLFLPDTGGTVVEQDFTQTVTNKTLNLSSNTVTDTSAVSGDVLVHNGTKFVRKAQGANGTFLGVSGGVTGFFSPGGGGSPGGSSGQLQYNNAGSFAGTSTFSFNGTGITTAASAYIEFGTTAPATGAFIRFEAAASDLINVRNSGNTADQTALYQNGSGLLFVGGGSGGVGSQFVGTLVSASSQVDISIGSNNAATFNATEIDFNIGATEMMSITSSAISYAAPRLGLSSPYASEGVTQIVTTGASVTLTAAEYSKAVILFTGTGGGAFTFPLPADNNHSYVKDIINSTAGLIQIDCGSTGINISDSARMLFSPTGVTTILGN